MKPKEKFTPGPLKAVQLDEWWYVMRSDGIEVATIGQHSEHERGDAILYAAAPTMYEALKYVLDSLENDKQLEGIDFANELYEIKKALSLADGGK